MSTALETVHAFLKKAGVCYLATTDGDQPRVRPFGQMAEYQGRLYFHTSKEKAVSRQLHENPKVEICAMAAGAWIRVEAEAYADPTEEAHLAVLEAKPQLKRGYAFGDGKSEVFYLQNVTATISSFTSEPQVYHF